MRKFLIIGLAVLVAVLGLTALAGCGGKEETTTTTAAPSTETTAAPSTETTAAEGFTPISPPVEVNVAFDDAPGTAGIILADKLGFFEKAGIKVKYTKFNTGADMYSALAANKVDVGRGIITASLFNGAAQGINVWVVADSGTNVPGKGNYFGIVVRKDLADQIKDYPDLKGRKILIVSRGSINELFLELALEKGGLTIDDVNSTVIDSFPDLNTALGNKAADVAVQIEPLITKGVEDGILVPFPKDAQDYAPGEQVAALLYSSEFAKNTEVARAFMYAYLQGVRAYNDAIVQGDKDRDEVIKILTENTFVSDPAMWVKMNPTGLNPDGTVLTEAVARDQQFYMKKGLVEKEAPIDQVVDNSFAEWASSVLGPYEPPK
ncbi:MAG: NrtA/SsuA/CpmA family ABC transporter substrate-binding protein [Thermoleophilia bacterium]